MPNMWRKFTKLSLKKKIFSIVGFIVVLIIIWGYIGNLTKKPPYTTVKAQKQTVSEVVVESGNIVTSGRTDIYSPTNGVVTSLNVQNDQAVEKGEELLVIESTATEQEKADALSGLLAAQSDLGTAKATMYSLQSAMYGAWDTFHSLATNSTYQNSDGSPNSTSRNLPEFTTAQADWLAAEASFKNQQSVVNKANAALASAQEKYNATQNATIKATAAGIVSNLSVTVGENVKINTPTQPATPVLSIVNLGTTEVSIPLAEADIVKVKPGQKAVIEIGALDKKYNAIVTRVDSLGTSNQGVIRYNVYLQILNPDRSLKPGMTADATITTNVVYNVLAVPNSAVKPYQGGRAVRVPGKKRDDIVFVPVQIGIKGSNMTQILKGISEGQEVITSLSNEKIQRAGLFGG